MEFNNKQFDKAFKKNNAGKIISSIIVVLGIISLLFGVVRYVNEKNNIRSMNELISTEKGDGHLAYVDLMTISYLASLEDDSTHYYLVGDEENRLYILQFADAEVDPFFDRLNAIPETDSYRVYGYTGGISKELKEFAIPEINTIFEEEFLDEATFEEYIGDILLVAAKDNKISFFSGLMETGGSFIMLGLFAAIVGGIWLLSANKANNSFTKGAMETWKDKDEFWAEINEPSTIWLENVKTYLTDKHIICLDTYLNIVDYNDLDFVYPTRHLYNGAPTTCNLTVYKKDGKQVNLANGKINNKKWTAATEEAHNVIMNKIMEKNPECLLGYNDYNLTRYSELVAARKGGVTPTQVEVQKPNVEDYAMPKEVKPEGVIASGNNEESTLASVDMPQGVETLTNNVEENVVPQEIKTDEVLTSSKSEEEGVPNQVKEDNEPEA